MTIEAKATPKLKPNKTDYYKCIDNLLGSIYIQSMEEINQIIYNWLK